MQRAAEMDIFFSKFVISGFAISACLSDRHCGSAWCGNILTMVYCTNDSREIYCCILPEEGKCKNVLSD